MELLTKWVSLTLQNQAQTAEYRLQEWLLCRFHYVFASNLTPTVLSYCPQALQYGTIHAEQTLLDIHTLMSKEKSLHYA
jgi:hypothetical protein